jgi:endonuclease/exonuclease/phosphatase family metal-dependent hydrolase
VELRVCAYNVRGFRDGLGRVAGVVSRYAPDVLLLNETGGRLALARFGRAVGMAVAADPWSPFRRRVKDAVLARPPWRIERSEQHRFATVDRWYPRGALVAVLARDGVTACAIAVHLSLRPAERRRHVELVARLAEGCSGPAVVGGDLNERPDGEAIAHLGERLGDAWLLGGDASGDTFPADEPSARIDYVFVSPGVRVERAIVPASGDAPAASDHRPVVAVLTLPDR